MEPFKHSETREPTTGRLIYLGNPRYGHVVKSDLGYIIFDSEMEARMFVVNCPKWRYIADYNNWKDIPITSPVSRLVQGIQYDPKYAVKVADIDT